MGHDLSVPEASYDDNKLFTKLQNDTVEPKGSRRATVVNLECKEREPADGENGNDDEEHAHNAFPFVESFGGGSVKPGGREFTWCGMEPQRVGDMTVRHQHCQNLQQTFSQSAPCVTVGNGSRGYLGRVRSGNVMG